MSFSQNFGKIRMRSLDLFDNPVGYLTSPAVFQAESGLKQGFSLAKPRFLAEVVQKLKFLNNSIEIKQPKIISGPTKLIGRLTEANKKLEARIAGLEALARKRLATIARKTDSPVPSPLFIAHC